ncbi:hypothetical protein HDU76_007842 [Blyttiomyces sp. JEL0837]|nr:hypothetical protein HDU76_007842 [Blyttiomyces sp. JEL0837]
MVRPQQLLNEASLKDPDAFWGEAAKDIVWHTKPTKTLHLENGSLISPTWFHGGKLSTYYNCVDRHIDEGFGDRVAIYYDSPLTNTKDRITYKQLKERVEILSAVFHNLFGVRKGDTVVIYMPMVPEAIYGMLASARLGAVHSVVFGGFAAPELAKRIDDCKPKVLLYGACGLEPTRIVPYKPFVDEALTICKHRVPHKLVFERRQCRVNLAAGELSWQITVHKAAMENLAIPPIASMNAKDPLYLLYTSGSTGTPKGVVRDNGGHAVALRYAMKTVFGVNPGDVFFSGSDIGWVVGHSFIVYGPLLQGCSTVLYEGKPIMPDVGAGAFWRIVEEYKVKALFTAPTAIRAIRREDPNALLNKKYNIKTLKGMFLAGERSDPETVSHFMRALEIPLRDNFWQTETGWPITAACAMPSEADATTPKPGSAGPPVPGYRVCILTPTHDGEDPDTCTDWMEAHNGVLGSAVVKLPLPPGAFITLWNNHEGYLKRKFPGYYDLTDAGYLDNDGFLNIMGRTDDVLNIAGHRLSAGGMEEVLASHPAVAECAVVALRDNLKGEKPLGFVVLKSGFDAAGKKSNDALEKELIAAIRSKVGPIACMEKVLFVGRLPKTRSGKILRRTMKAIANGDKFTVPPTIEDVEGLESW